MTNAVFRVFVNQVDVGAIPEQDYRNIVSKARQQVKADRRLYVSQAANLAYCTYRVAATFLNSLPVVVCVLLAAGLLFKPDFMTDLITILRTDTPSQLTQGLRQILMWIGMLSVLILVFSAALTRNRFGFINKFESARSERVSLRIRAMLEVPAEGDVAVQVGAGFRL